MCVQDTEVMVMGEMVSISIGSYDFLSYKNTFGDLLTPFCMADLHIEPDTIDGEKITKRYFSTTVKKVKICLDVLGYTLEVSKKTFEKCKQGKVEFASEYPRTGDFSSEKLKIDFTYKNWCKTAQYFARILSNDHFQIQNCKYIDLERQRLLPHTLTEQIVLSSLPYGGETFFGIDCEFASWEIFRVLLDAFDDDQQIILDYTNLYEGGWCSEIPEQEIWDVPKTIILTEGKYDAAVISQAMDILYPYMSKFYSLMDFSLANVQGSANFLTHYLKAFIGAKIQNRIIALYDNDAAGLSEIMSLDLITIPTNVRVLHLPDLKLCNAYPTIGPTINEDANINGRACSIELFLGHDVLVSEGNLMPIMWTGYNEKTKSYQGTITHKGDIQKKFDKKILCAKENGISDSQNWEELDILLNYIFAAFQDTK